ncbi:cupin domain-containing protein [Planotetraspora mira]|jgi:uncharacterized cupin superfamily protein|uniref:(S)-ureidoglycine aminohydrolase cupin domain-containing protein n=1 Tax=Planotetraspora mira TaxID=58121 RepID=A0A8J3TTC3_9ACTN|nr:cupin domain-containing protein [Planotetraspora mira]GII31771.1 hypothetical protein Pmi06nite_52130 [Planotetraspora mira]
MDISAITVLGATGRAPYVPPLSDYASASPSWAEAEFGCFDTATDSVRVGYWTGEPGTVRLDPWPYTEICSILTGRVAVADTAGGRIDFGPGDGFVVPKGFVGDWLTLEPATKYFIAVG